jgi:hypothetical protein
MPSHPFVPAPVAHWQLLRPLTVAAAVVTGVLAPVLLPGAVALADQARDGTVVGELVQAWAEAAPADAAAGSGAEGMVSWVQPAQGDPVLVDSAGVEGVPSGSTVSLTVGAPSADPSGDGTPLPVVDATVVALPTAAPARVTNEVTVAMVAPAGSAATGDGTTLAQVVSAVDDRVAPFWSEQSDGAISLRVTRTHDWAAASVDCSNPGKLWDDVATRVNFVPGPGKHLMLYVSRDSACTYALAEVGSTPASGGRLYVRDTTTSVIAHEFGHNFGLGHSSGQQCDGVVEGGSCRTVGYRDYYDVMGVSWAQLGTLNVAQAALLGVLPPAQQQALSVWDAAGTATLSPLSSRSGTRALRLTDAEGVDYWIEYRTPIGQDGWLSSANRFSLDSGVLIRRAGGLPDTSVLLDGTPSTAAGWDGDHRAALPLGVAMPISGGDFSVVVQSLSADGAVVSVTPTPPATASDAAPAPQRAPHGSVMAGGAGNAPDAGAPVVADGTTTGFWAPVYRATHQSDARLETVADASGGTGYLVAAAAAALAGVALLLQVLRRNRLRGC